MLTSDGVPQVEKEEIVSEEKDKPVFDERPLARLLEAAFVLQEHNRELQKLELDLEHQKDRLATQEESAPETLVVEPVGVQPESETGQPGAIEAQRSEPQAPVPGPCPTEPSVPAPSLVAPALPELPIAEVPIAQAPIAEPALAKTPPAEASLSAPALAKAAPVEILAGPAPKESFTFSLGQIVETQHQIRVRNLQLEDAMSLVAERVTEIAKAGGAAIGFLDGKKVRYRGVAGNMALPPGTEVLMEKALCSACLRTGQVLRCADVNPEFLVDAEECHRRGIQAMIAVPIFNDAGIAGGLELYYDKVQAFTEQDVHSCQLMAGLITEALGREEEATPKSSLVSERTLMLEALEKLKPSLAALLEKTVGKAPTSKSANLTGELSASAVTCRKCGHQLMREEQFCGNCGSPRSSDRNAAYEAPSMQSKVASLWQMQEALKHAAAAAHPNGDLAQDLPNQRPSSISDDILPEKPLADSIEEEMPELFAAPELRIARMAPPLEPSRELSGEPELAATMRAEERPAEGLADNDNVARKEIPALLEAGPVDQKVGPEEDEAEPEKAIQEAAEPAATTALAKIERAVNWSSATSARDFLEQLAGAKRTGGLARFWAARRGDIYLAVAVVLVAAVIRWGIWSNHSVGATASPATPATGHHKPAPDADLSTFDRMLISLGLAEAPPAPEYRGNPDTQVWIDLHTALYYCPGADLYGKTPKGRFATQRDAQLDQFEPAYRKTCD